MMIIACLSFMAFSASAFIGNNMFGKNWCVVGCGRGPLGIAPLGDVIKGANEMAFGPTMEAFEQRGKNIVDYASAKLDQGQIKLDKSLEENLAKLTEVSQDSIEQLDQVLKSNIDIGLEGLSRQIAALDIVGSKKTDDLNVILRGFVLFGVVALLIVWIAQAIGRNGFNPRTAWVAARWRIATSVVAILVVVVVPSLIPQLKYKIPDIKEELEENYAKHMEMLSFQKAAYISEKLVAVDPENSSYLRQRDRADLLRDVFYNPTTYRTVDGLTRTQFMLESLLTTTQYDQSPPKKVLVQPDSSLEITLAMIAWQVRQDDVTRYQVANICATIIERELKLAETARSPLLPLALHYLRSYLSNPVQDFELKWLLQKSARESDDDYAANYKPKELLQLRKILVDGSSSVRSFPNSFEGSRLAAQIRFGEKVSQTYAVAIPAYMQMLQANFDLRKADPNAKAAKQALRDKYANEVISAWDGLISSSLSPEFSVDLNSRLTLLSALHATYTRAKLYLRTENTGAVRAALTEAESKALPDSDKFHDQWTKGMQGSIRPSGIPVVGYRIRAQYELDQAALAKFEASFSALIDKADSWELAQSAAEQASRLGLYVCAQKIDDPERDLFKTVNCGSPDANSYKALWLIYSMLPTDKRPSVSSWRKYMELGIQRPIPVI
ncbi:hypothetical protein [Pseudorhodoferax sp.]|uniref:hypothetical protein n=1 Tax=Pseudorhodoferax sp. TaxID=1993553 RepID=UPI0039E374CD